MAMLCPPLSLARATSTSSPRPSLPLARSSLDKRNSAARFPIFSTTKTQTLRLRSIHIKIVKVVKASTSGVTPSDGDDAVDGLLEDWEVETSSPGTSFLAKLAIALGIAATMTLLSVCAKWSSSGTSYSLPVLLEGSSPSAVSPAGFTLTIFGQRIILPEYAPGWVYFWLLMAAGCGLFISEEALNVWVGISLARTLTLNGNWQSFASSFSRNSPYIISTVLWVYWGVCISDMIPFYLGRFFRKTKASESICTKLGIDKEKAVKITQVVRKYGNLIGFVERFSVGVRNPTAFLAGAWGISSECFFAGVCFGGLVTLPLQLAIGFLLRERPAVALASVGTIVGVWTAFPYILAASTTLFLFVRNNINQQNHS
ncbi:uncharacterized protein M6B38_299775 [Iris pallida]|uniref:VTT domain-containing protein n=1 Tax=Iris pallida TaxID=29817 RepID=A0AAX6HPM2_IRIPA|nr:uncharacterized protein M6B38_299775 [Iris pallida]